MIAFFLFEFYWLLFSWFCFIRNINYKQRMKRDKERKTNDVRLWMQNGCVVLAEWYDSKSIRHSGKIYWTVILARVFNLAVSPNGNLLNLSIQFPWFALESNKVTNRFFKPCSVRTRNSYSYRCDSTPDLYTLHVIYNQCGRARVQYLRLNFI